MTDTGLDLASPSVGHRAPTRSKRSFGCLAALLVLALVGVGLYVAVTKGVEYIDARLNGPGDYAGDGHGSVRVKVLDGQTATEIAGTLVDKNVVQSVGAFTSAAAADPAGNTIQPGVYALHEEMSAESALALLLSDDSRVEVQVSLPEGLTTDEIVASIARQSDLSVHDLNAALERPALLGLPAYATGQEDGYLFPASYTIEPGTTARELLTMLVDRFDQAASDLHLASRAQELGVSPHDVVTVASLVEAEASRPQDLGKVAQVIYNRDQQGMALQLDSTVQFIAGSNGKVYTTEEQRQIDSPYNTYLYPGLPPGAIGAPGEAALEAALDPTPGPWLYFVTVNPDTGKTLFAETLSEHSANVAKLRRFCLSSDTC